MKKILFSVLMALVVISCSNHKQNSNSVIIKGEVLSGDAKDVRFEWIVDNPISGVGKTFIAELDDNSKFSIEIPLKRIANGRIAVGNFFHDICLLPGDDFFVSIDGDTIKYSGHGAEKNNYLYQTEINNLDDRDYYSEYNRFKLAPVDMLEFLHGFRQRRLDFLDTYMDSVELQKEFVDFYKIETQVIYEELIQGYPGRYSRMNNIPYDSLTLPEEFIRLNNFSEFVDDSKVVSSDYIFNLHNRLFDKIEEIRKADTLMAWKDALWVALLDSLSGKTREYVLTNWITTDLSRDNYDSVAIKKFKEIEKGELAQETFNYFLSKFNDKQQLIGKPLHKEFAETILKDTAEVNLSFGEMMAKYKGKVVYLDFWGIGCGACRMAMPYSKKLKDKLKDEPIEFVYISVHDIGQDNWQKAFDITYTDKNHYVVQNGYNSRLHKFMEIHWVPCYMIFDKAGNLVSFNAERPTKDVEQSESKLVKILKELAAE